MSTRTTIEIDRKRIAELTEREQKRLDKRTDGSRAYFERARTSLVGGVPSAYQERDPWPIYLSHGLGSRVWDVDGNEMIDFHNGFGSMVQGHAHPAIVRAVQARVELGRTSPRRPRTGRSSPRSSPPASACRAGGS